MVLNVIDRPGNAYAAMKHLLTDNHEDRARQRKHIHRAIEIYRALLAGGVVERLDEPDEQGRYVRLTVDLQYDFALNQPLSPFALAAIDLLDRNAETYALDVLSVIESTLDDPRQILSAQQFRARGEAVAAMKADGRRVRGRGWSCSTTSPTPSRSRTLLEAAYEIYRRGHPWVGDYAVSPKSVVRDMFERAMTFGEYVQFYGLSRSEGDRAALPRRRLQGAAADRARRGQDRGAHRPHRVARRAGPAGRLLARSTSGRSSANPDPESAVLEGAAEDADEQHAGVPGAGAERAVPAGHPRGAASDTTSSANSTRPTAGPPRLGGRPRGVLRAARRDRHRAGRARPGDADHRGGPDAPGPSGRSSTTRRATTTGASPPRSTSPPPTTRARRSSTSPTSGSSDETGTEG